MPLILISGYPSSGKSTRAQQIKKFFESRISSLDESDPKKSKLKVHVISDNDLGLSKEIYREARQEKDARATFYGAIKRVLSRDDIVIADGMNYIKGYRYQLYCESKALETPSCVVHVGAPADKVKEWNNAKLHQSPASNNNEIDENNETSQEKTVDSEAYAPDLLENLVFRYEEPNGMTRWDSPLFTVPWMDEDIPGEQLWDSMINREGVRPNLATVLKPATASTYLQELDKTTQEIVALVIDFQKHNGDSGGEVPVPGVTVPLDLPPKLVTLGQLQRMRRQFISLNRSNSFETTRLRHLFVEYLNDGLS